MPERIIAIEKGSTYHFYNRGVNRELIFYSSRNYQYFLTQLGKYMIGKASILAYCLMPNHFHLLLEIHIDHFVQKAFSPFLISYTKALNLEKNRVGPLFQGRFKANLIGNEEFLLDCVKYIHLNPVKAGLTQVPAGWEFSSYRNYINNSQSMVETREVLQYFSTRQEFRDFSEFGIDVFESQYFTETD